MFRSLFIARCHGNQQRRIWPKMSKKNCEKTDLHHHISNNLPILILIFIRLSIIAKGSRLRSKYTKKYDFCTCHTRLPKVGGVTKYGKHF